MTDGPELLRIGVDGVVPVQWEAEKNDADNGMLVGWASVYNVIDQQDDVVIPGAFRKTMSEWNAAKGQRVIGLTLDHQNTAEGLIGALAKFDDTAYGLKTGFRFSSVAKAQDARAKAREGILNGLSIYGPIFKKAFDNVAGKSVRILQEVGLAFVGLTPMPANTGSLVLTAKAVSDKPWSQFTQADYTDEQWARACLVDTGEGEGKQRYKLPVKEPSGTISRAGCHAAAARINQLGVSSELRSKAARALVRIYRSDLKEDPPESLLRMAGMASSALLSLPDDWVTDMRSALGITVPEARDAAVGVLVKSQYGQVLAPPPEAVDEPDPTSGEGGVDDDRTAAEYALAVIGESGPGMDPPGGEPSDSLDGLLASLDAADITSDLNALEAELRSVSSDHADASEGSR
jgi:HK97 family phage prohead protease